MGRYPPKITVSHEFYSYITNVKVGLERNTGSKVSYPQASKVVLLNFQNRPIVFRKENKRRKMGEFNFGI